MLHDAGERGCFAGVGAMSEKLRQMERLKQVRKTRERLDEASVARAAARLREVETRLSALQEAELMKARAAICAMEAGERTQWAPLQAVRVAFGLDCQRVEKEQAECSEELATAQKALRQSRIHTEQAAALYQNVRDALLQEEERRTQTETVDRFLARSRWNMECVRVRSLIEAG